MDKIIKNSLEAVAAAMIFGFMLAGFHGFLTVVSCY